MEASAQGLFGGAQSAGGALGLALGGALYHARGPTVAFGAGAAAFALSFVAFGVALAYQPPPPPPPPPPRAEDARVAAASAATADKAAALAEEVGDAGDGAERGAAIEMARSKASGDRGAAASVAPAALARSSPCGARVPIVEGLVTAAARKARGGGAAARATAIGRRQPYEQLGRADGLPGSDDDEGEEEEEEEEPQ